jgi:hypothetical protein
MSTSSIHTMSIGHNDSLINPELVERIIYILNEYLESLQAEQDAIETSSSDSHDEMAAEDQHWDELDAQIEEVKDVLYRLGCDVDDRQ